MTFLHTANAILILSVTAMPFLNSCTSCHAVDIGLSVRWAETNIGAASPTDGGNYYAWGETCTKDHYTWDSYTCTTDECGTSADLLQPTPFANIAGSAADGSQKPEHATFLNFDATGIYYGFNHRCAGFSIRPVWSKDK